MKRHIGLIALLLVIGAIQVAASASGALYYLTQLTLAAYATLAVLGLCLLMGYAGQISLGHAAFFAIGGYTAAVMTTWNLKPAAQSSAVLLLTRLHLTISSTDLYGTAMLRLSPWIALVTAVMLTALIALLIGIPVLRLRGHYLAMATLGFGSIVTCIVLAAAVFGQADGISEVPSFTLFRGLTIAGGKGMRVQNYYFAWGLVVVAMILLTNLVHSRPGRALRAIHGHEEAAAAMGVDTARLKLSLFVLSAVTAAIAGVFATHFKGGISPADAGIMQSVRYVAIVAIGGMANLWGALIWGIVLTFLSLRGTFGSYDDLFFGSILVAIMALAPDGVFSRSVFSNLLAAIKDVAKRVTARSA